MPYFENLEQVLSNFPFRYDFAQMVPHTTLVAREEQPFTDAVTALLR